MAPLRDTRRPALAMNAAATTVAAAVAVGAVVAQHLSAPFGALAIAFIAARRTTLIRWSILLLVAQLAVSLAGAGRTLHPLALLAAPALVACAELAYAADELRRVPLEAAGLLGQRLRIAGEAVMLALLVAGAVVVITETPLPRGAGLTVAGLLAAATATGLLARSRTP